MIRQVSTFLMFAGQAEEALRFYAGLFPGAEAGPIERFRAGDAGPEGKVKAAHLVIDGQRLMFFDSPVRHEFGMTPSISLFVECDDTDELDRIAAALGKGGQVLMPLDGYDFATRFTWINDRFGLSWQLCFERK